MKMIVEEYPTILDEVLSKLIKHNIQNQQKIKTDLDFIAYAKEFCTIKLGAWRRSGHSTALVKNAIRYCENCLILTYTLSQSEYLMSMFKEEAGDQITVYDQKTVKLGGDRTYHFSTFGAIKEGSNRFMGIRLDSVMVDIYSFMSKEKTDLLYELTEPCMSQEELKLFVFME